MEEQTQLNQQSRLCGEWQTETGLHSGRGGDY
jgi:hypothetical protein